MTLAGGRRTVLFLQGPPTPFWADLADGFEAAGHRTLRVNLCMGDRVLWRRKGALDYRGRLSGWSAWLEALVAREGVTDILYFADRHPYHVAAKALAERLGIRAYAMEFGYLRPDWLTLERGGMGVYSHFPDDPDLIRAAAAKVPAASVAQIYSHTFNQEAWYEVTYNLSTVFCGFLYPFYDADKYYHPIVDYLTWVRRLATSKAALAHADAVVRGLEKERTPFFLVALQLQMDYQIRANSPYRHLSMMLDEVIGSFKANADPQDRLVIKTHPLDNGYENWPKVVRRIAEAHGVADRVILIEGGNLGVLLSHAKGVLVVNSTVGLQSLRLGRPTKVLGIAVFDVRGLTHQGPLDGFWREPGAVDLGLCDALVRLMAAAIQVKGSFYHPDGRKAAVREVVRRVAEDRVNQPDAFVPALPRMRRARAIGVPIR
ncbi:capsule biosynthesis protein [Chthonobacter rhizosphaerae]|uniref:capsule biosynthesis protein n=1 Tax=Chthonobacter rhizosphaerae TaxID=2735553 RepID=UPI0015EEA71B|nr:capsular biosynthesis protein [Chthonobacter rhizosphaerae]